MNGVNNQNDLIVATAQHNYRGDAAAQLGGKWRRTSTGRPILLMIRTGVMQCFFAFIAHLNAQASTLLVQENPPCRRFNRLQRTHRFWLTIFPIDQEDLYIYQRQGSGYVYQAGKTRQVVEETITVEVIIGESAAPPLAMAPWWHKPKHTCSPGEQPGWNRHGALFQQYRIHARTKFSNLCRRVESLGAPSENQVYVDIDGNIGYKPAGRFPKCEQLGHLLPVPGDGRYEWDGYFDMDVLPEEYNPERGFSGTANAMSFQNYPINEYRVGLSGLPLALQRLWEVLQNQTSIVWRTPPNYNVTTNLYSRVKLVDSPS